MPVWAIDAQGTLDSLANNSTEACGIITTLSLHFVSGSNPLRGARSYLAEEKCKHSDETLTNSLREIASCRIVVNPVFARHNLAFCCQKL